MLGKMDFTVVIWLFNGVFIGLCCLTTYNTCSVVYNCYQYISDSITTRQKYIQDSIFWSKYVIEKQNESNMINYIIGRDEMCNDFLHNVMIEYPKKDT